MYGLNVHGGIVYYGKCAYGYETSRSITALSTPLYPRHNLYHSLRKQADPLLNTTLTNTHLSNHLRLHILNHLATNQQPSIRPCLCAQPHQCPHPRPALHPPLVLPLLPPLLPHTPTISIPHPGGVPERTSDESNSRGSPPI
jgi:hypothetical protein